MNGNTPIDSILESDENIEGFNICYSFLMSKLDKIYNATEFSDDLLTFRSVVTKFISVCKSFGINPDHLNRFEQESKDFVKSIINQSLSVNNLRDKTESLISFLSSFKVAVSKLAIDCDVTPIPELLDFGRCDKERIIGLIEECITIVEQTQEVRDKTKQRILKFLNKVITELEKEKPDWSKVLSITSIIVTSLSIIYTPLSKMGKGEQTYSLMHKMSSIASEITIQSTINQTYNYLQVINTGDSTTEEKQILQYVIDSDKRLTDGKLEAEVSDSKK